MDYDAIEAMVDAPFQKEQLQSSASMDIDSSRRNSKRYHLISVRLLTLEQHPNIGIFLHQCILTASPDFLQLVANGYLPLTLIQKVIGQVPLVIGRDLIQGRRSADTQEKGIGIVQVADVIALDLVHPDILETTGTMANITGITGTTGITEIGTTAITEIVVATTATATIENIEEATLGSVLHEEVEALKDMAGAAVTAAGDLLHPLQMRRLVIEERVGYVEFYDEDSVAKAIALTGQKLLGIPVIAKHTESEKNRLALQAASQAQAAAEVQAQAAPVDLSQHRLYVGSVNFDLSEDDLKQVLEPFGPIEFIKLHRDAETGKSKGFAFVQYRNAEDAKQAMERMNGYELAGRTIKVGLVTEKGSSQSNSYYYNNTSHFNNSISIDDSDTAGYALTPQSRTDLMLKLARGDASLGAGAPAATQAASTPTAPSFVPPRQLPVVMPSRSVLLKNMFTDEDKTEPEWAKELEEDVKEEAEKNGQVVHIHVEQESQGEIYLKFDSVQSATNAVQTLGGRFFAGRQIVAAFLPEMLYNVRFPRAANL
ncbi:hypothetical protein BGX20_004675 [Mortierella sp. AD010]|nr:hypothetical protein BGX20_004675 [Mortierella sp. AD010]